MANRLGYLSLFLTFSTTTMLMPCTAMSQPQNQFVLVVDGQPKAEIVAKTAATPGPVQLAGEELQKYVREMSGATLPMVSQSTGKPGIIITTDTKSVGLEPKNEDHYLIKGKNSNLYIVAASPRAALYGVYDLLERLGCGWCVPGDDTVPKSKTLKLPVPEVSTAPAFKYRMMNDFPMNSPGQSVAVADWLAKNRMNGIRPLENAHGEPKIWYARRERVAPEIKKRGLYLIFGGHTMHTWVSEEYFEEHPEWFAYNDGKREPPTLCVTNQEMVAELIKNMRHFLDRCPEVDAVDLWHPDGMVYCHCPACTRGVLTESTKGKTPESMPEDSVQSAYVISYLVLLNQVAEAIHQSHPKVMVSPLIYGASDRALPDSAPPLNDNLLFGLAHIFRDSYRPLAGDEPKSPINMRFLGNDITWMAKAKNSYIYKYYNGWAAPFIYPGSRVIVRDLQILKAVGCPGIVSEMYGYSPINMYVAARALWSPDISWEDSVRDYCTRYFGDVAIEMADNRITMENQVYGMAGFHSNGALEDYWKWCDPACGKWLHQQRPRQIKFLEGLVAQTSDPLVKVRLERSLKPWKVWSAEPRFWAFPVFEGDENPEITPEFDTPPGIDE